MRTHVKAYLSNKDTINTDFNGGPSEVIGYYVGKQFNIGTDGDKMVYCHGVEIDGIVYNPSTHRSISERAHEKNLALIISREQERDKLSGPRIGDFVLIGGVYLRFTHDWGSEIQVTCLHYGDATQHHGFYCNKNGTSSYSGSLDPSIKKVDLTLSEEVRNGNFWMFNEDYADAHNGIHFQMPCRVYTIKAA